MSPAATPSHSIRELEGLRGLLALMVLVGHWGTTITQPLAPLQQNLWNTDAVDVFIILSGFVITALLSREDTNYRAYLVRRWFRIAPAFIVVTLICALLMPLTQRILLESLPSAMRDERLSTINDARQYWGWHLAAHLTLLHGLVPTSWDRFAPYAIIGQGWSIALEWQFYVLAPLFYCYVKSHRWMRKVALVALLALLVVTAKDFSLAYLGNKVGYFIVGYASYRLWVWQQIDTARYSLMRMRVAVVGLSVIALILRAHLGLGIALWCVVFGMLLLSRREGATLEKCLCQGWLHPSMQFLGAHSYTLYLVHFQVLMLVLWALGPASMASWMMSGALLVLTIVFSIGAAMLVSRTIERPGMRWGKTVAMRINRVNNA